MGRLLWRVGGELHGGGDDGGLDCGGAPFEKTGGVFIGLNGGGVEVSQDGEELFGGEVADDAVCASARVWLIAASTHSRLVGGSSLWSERLFWRE